MYFLKSLIYQKIKDTGGSWNDSKLRPVVCLVESTEKSGLFWAIPVGNWNHRDDKAKERIKKFLSCPDTDLRSCYYHIGNTNEKSIFFISDVIPITEKYVEKEYLGFNKKVYVIKNEILLQILNYKLSRILAFESSKNNYFRQHITDIKKALIHELERDAIFKEITEISEVQKEVAPVKEKVLRARDIPKGD